MKYAKKRDGNEKEIVDALEAIGASVTRLGDAGVPDLLVAYRGETLLLEVKDPAQAAKAYRAGRGGGRVALTAAQRKWWARPWPGGRRAVVESVDEALAFVRGDGPRGVDGWRIEVDGDVARATATADDQYTVELLGADRRVAVRLSPGGGVFVPLSVIDALRRR